MSQKSSLPQAASSVSQVLKRDNGRKNGLSASEGKITGNFAKSGPREKSIPSRKARAAAISLTIPCTK
jgi:hypothetical protein